MTEALDDLLDVLDNHISMSPEARILRSSLLQELLAAYWVSRQAWPQKAKYALAAIRQQDPELGRVISEFASAALVSTLARSAQAAAGVVLAPVGGLLRESWHRTPEYIGDK